MQYNRESKIATVSDVKDFFLHLVCERSLYFCPDDRFEGYISSHDGKRLFTQEECAIYNRLMDESFDVCEKNGADIYAIGLETYKHRTCLTEKNI